MSRSYRPPPRPSAARAHADLLFQFVTSTSRGAPPEAKAPTAPSQPDSPDTKPNTRARESAKQKP